MATATGSQPAQPAQKIRCVGGRLRDARPRVRAGTRASAGADAAQAMAGGERSAPCGAYGAAGSATATPAASRSACDISDTGRRGRGIPGHRSARRRGTGSRRDTGSRRRAESGRGAGRRRDAGGRSGTGSHAGHGTLELISRESWRRSQDLSVCLAAVMSPVNLTAPQLRAGMGIGALPINGPSGRRKPLIRLPPDW
jgi:hypothetical protein